MSSVGTHIRRLRTARHMTQEQLAERLFVTRQAVSAWETGKALPDVETLERIAAGLDAGVTEVIYGVPKTPDLKRQRRKWMAASAISAIISVLIIIILVDNGSYDTWRRGLIYQFHSTRYTLCQEKIPGTWSVELDLTDLESNAEKVLYEDETGCRIVVDQVWMKTAPESTGSGFGPTAYMTAPAGLRSPAVIPFPRKKPPTPCPCPPG